MSLSQRISGLSMGYYDRNREANRSVDVPKNYSVGFNMGTLLGFGIATVICRETHPALFLVGAGGLGAYGLRVLASVLADRKIRKTLQGQVQTLTQ